jgi:hypothetical protein
MLANLLWEDIAYQDGESVVDQIRSLIPSVAPGIVADIAEEARVKQRLRHVPLLLARECARHESHRHVVAELLPKIVRRPDELTEFLSLYFADGHDRHADAPQPLAKGVKKGLAKAFQNFSAYQLAKYDRQLAVKLKDVMFLVHPEPKDLAQAAVFRQLAAGTLLAPDTWEVALSRGDDKRATWERLIDENKLGALAFLRNLRNMEAVGVSARMIRKGFAELKTEWLLPLNFFAAVQAAPRWLPEIEVAMFDSLAQTSKLIGETHLIVDVSGSMSSSISGRSVFSRLNVAAAMTVLAREMCEHVTVWATAGSDMRRTHKTKMLIPHRGFALAEQVELAARQLGGGGIFTRQCLNYVREQVGVDSDRTIIFSDSQDCDRVKAVPEPFSRRNYIVDVSAHTRGVAYDGIWTAEISGWSEDFFRYIEALESTQGAA